MAKTWVSLGNKRFGRINRPEANKIVDKISDYGTRSKLRKEIKFYKFGAGGTTSYKDITEKIKPQGLAAVDKFIRAAIECGKKEKAVKVDAKSAEKRPVAKWRRELDTSYEKYEYGGGAKIGVSNNVTSVGAARSGASALAGAGGGVRGDAARLGVRTRQAQAGVSALQNRPVNTPKPEAPVKPLGGIKPII